MDSHELKTDPDVFDAVAAGHKTFEIRFDDRGFKVGDALVLNRTKHTGETMRAGLAPLEFTGHQITCMVTHILRGPVYGLADGWVILSIAVKERIVESRREILTACSGFIGAMEVSRRAIKAIRDALSGGMAHSRKSLEESLPRLEADLKLCRLDHQGAVHINSNVRMFDLVRSARSELHEEGLITDSEYSWLCAEAELATSPECGSPSPRRLEDYDDLRTKLDASHADADRLAECLSIWFNASGSRCMTSDADALAEHEILKAKR